MAPAVCRRVRAEMDDGRPEPAEVLEDEARVRDGVRRAVHVEVGAPILALVDAHLEAQRDAIARFYQRQLGAREGVGLLRYPSGGFYRRHIDRAQVPSWPAAAERTVSVVLFLESSREVDPLGGFSGGLLRVMPEDGDPLEIAPEQGTLVAFLATTPHEVSLVRDGVRDTAVDWFTQSVASG